MKTTIIYLTIISKEKSPKGLSLHHGFTVKIYAEVRILVHIDIKVIS